MTAAQTLPAAVREVEPISQRLPRLLWAVALATLLLRIGAVVALKAWQNPNAMEFQLLARSFMGGNGLSFNAGWGYYGPSAIQSPTYTLIIVMAYALFGVDTPLSYAAVLILNALLASATVFPLFLLARDLSKSQVIATGTAIAFALWPTQVYAATHAQAVALITLLIPCMVLFFQRTKQNGSLGYWTAFCICGAVAALTEPVLLPVVAFSVPLMFLWRGIIVRRKLGLVGILLACELCIHGPWVVRNYMVFGKLVPTKATVWCNIWKGANPYATGTDRLAAGGVAEALRVQGPVLVAERESRQNDTLHQYDMLTKEQVAELWGKDEVQQEEVFKRWAKNWISEHPGQWAELCGLRFVKTIWIEWDNPKSRNLLYVASRSLLLPLAMAGLIACVRRGWDLRFIGTLMICVVLTHTLVIAAARFTLPLEPLALMPAVAMVTYRVCPSQKSHA